MIPSVFEVDPLLRVAIVSTPAQAQLEGFELLPLEGNGALYIEATNRVLAIEAANPCAVVDASVVDASTARIRIGVKRANGGFEFQDRFVRVFRQLPVVTRFRPLFAIDPQGVGASFRSFVGFVPGTC